MRTSIASSLLALLLNAASPGMCASVPSSLTVIVDYEQPHSSSSFEAMTTELKSIMKPVGISLEVRERASLMPNAEFGDLVIFKMTGSCDATPVPIEALSDERGPLAMAYASDGAILPFGEVRCDRVRICLQRTLNRGVTSRRESVAYGSALGKVIAHEIYHMLAHEPSHTKQGLTKPAISSRELLDQSFTLPDKAIEEIRRTLQRTN